MAFTHHDKKFWKELNYTLSFIIKVLLFNNTELRTLVVMVTSPKSLSYVLNNGSSYMIINCGVMISFNGMTSLPNFIKPHQLVESLLVGRRTDIINLPFTF
jgi:hypothetical protein